MTEAPLLAARNLTVGYGGVIAIENVSIEVRKGQIITVIGPNGAGKTTLLSALMGVIPKHSGDVRFSGFEEEAAIENLVERGMSLVPEKRELFGTMSVEDNLRLGAYSRRRQGKVNAKTLDEVYDLFPRLRERRYQSTNTLSGGERQMVAIGRALMSRPKLLMLDEPSLGLAPLIVREIFHIVSGLRQAGVGILLVEQNARAALQVADYGYVLEMGAIAMKGPAGELAHDKRVEAAYLGGGGAH